MKSCNVGEENDYYWGSPSFYKVFPDGIKYPQVFVATYPLMNKFLFEITADILNTFVKVIPVLSGSIVSGYDGRPPLSLLHESKEALTEFIRLPNIEELDFYERYSKL